MCTPDLREEYENKEMKKVLILYTSQNGSTHKVAEGMKSAFENAGFLVDLYRVNSAEKICFDNYEIIGIGCPTYIFRPSYEMMDYLDSCIGLSDKKVFTFVTYGIDVGDGANFLRRKIKKLRAVDVGYFTCTGRDLFPGYTDRGYLFSNNSPKNIELSGIEGFVKRVVSNVNSGFTTNHISYDPKPHFIYRFERFVTNRFFIKHLYSYFFKVNRKLFINCGKCINNCPTKNIGEVDGNRRVWGRNCIFCTQCDISCPRKAISTPISWFIFAPFLRFNIIKAKRKGVPYSKV